MDKVHGSPPPHNLSFYVCKKKEKKTDTTNQNDMFVVGKNDVSSHQYRRATRKKNRLVETEQTPTNEDEFLLRGKDTIFEAKKMLVSECIDINFGKFRWGCDVCWHDTTLFHAHELIFIWNALD